MLLLTLRGTPTIYQGEEIGMDRCPDPAGPGAGSRSSGMCRGSAWGGTRCARRCHGPRTPMAASPTAQPWLPLNADCECAERREPKAADPRSMLSLYRALIRLRREHDVAVARRDSADERRRRRARLRASHRRRARADRAQHERPAAGGPAREPDARRLLSTYLDDPKPGRRRDHLRANEGLILRCPSAAERSSRG